LHTLAGFNLNGPHSILSRFAEESNFALRVFVEKGNDPVPLEAPIPKKSGNCLLANRGTFIRISKYVDHYKLSHLQRTFSVAAAEHAATDKQTNVEVRILFEKCSASKVPHVSKSTIRTYILPSDYFQAIRDTCHGFVAWVRPDRRGFDRPEILK
jgi:hypothetical protein